MTLEGMLALSLTVVLFLEKDGHVSGNGIADGGIGTRGGLKKDLAFRGGIVGNGFIAGSTTQTW